MSSDPHTLLGFKPSEVHLFKTFFASREEKAADQAIKRHKMTLACMRVEVQAICHLLAGRDSKAVRQTIARRLAEERWEQVLEAYEKELELHAYRLENDRRALRVRRIIVDAEYAFA